MEIHKYFVSYYKNPIICIISLLRPIQALKLPFSIVTSSP